MSFFLDFSNAFPPEPPPADRSLGCQNSSKPGVPPQPVAVRAISGTEAEAHSSALGKTGGAK